MKQNAKKKKAIVAVCGAILMLAVITFAVFHFTQYNHELVRVFYAQPNAVTDRIAVFQGHEDRPLRALLERQNFDREKDGLISNIKDMDYQISGEHKGHELRDFTYYVYKKDSQWVLFNPTKNRCAVLSTEDTAALQTMLAPENLDKRAIDKKEP